MREFEYGMHCFRKHIALVIELLSEVQDKIASAKEKSKNFDELKQIMEQISVYRSMLRGIVEDTHKNKVEDPDEAIDKCIEIDLLLRDIRVYLDKVVLRMIELGVEESVYDEVLEAIGNIAAASRHVLDTIDNIILRYKNKEST